MTPEQSAAYVHAQVACAMAELFSMLAANAERRSHGYSAAYAEEAFMALQVKYCIGHNSVMTLFRRSQ